MALHNPQDFPDLPNDIFKVISILKKFKECRSCLNVIAHAMNMITMEIACSVTRDGRYQGGPQWLSSLLEAEAGY